MSNGINFREINTENLEAVLTLEVTDNQKKYYTRSNAHSIAEGHYPPDDDPVWMRAIYAEDTPVGFIMMSEAPDQGEFYLWRIMIDAQYQSKGYAEQAIKLLVKRLQESPNAKTLITSHLKDNGHAGIFFEKQGFLYTGETLGESDRLMEMGL